MEEFVKSMKSNQGGNTWVKLILLQFFHTKKPPCIAWRPWNIKKDSVEACVFCFHLEMSDCFRWFQNTSCSKVRRFFQSFSHCCNEGCWGKVWLGARAIVSTSKKWKLLFIDSMYCNLFCNAEGWKSLVTLHIDMICFFGKGFHDLTWFMVVKGTRKSVMMFHATFGFGHVP